MCYMPHACSESVIGVNPGSSATMIAMQIDQRICGVHREINIPAAEMS